jgi:peroxiredoxin Q/BCP
VIVVFAKAPVAGRVKTRLAATCGEEWAAGLHQAFVADVLETALSVGVPVELHTDAETDAWSEYPVLRRLQVAGDLGEKMLAVLRRAAPVVLVGSDIPSVPAGHLRQLLTAKVDLVLGATRDGGFYGIGARHAPPGSLFEGVEWSSGRELEQTRRNAKRAGLSVSVGPGWFDVDTVDDLRRLLAAPLPVHTARFLRLFPPPRIYSRDMATKAKTKTETAAAGLQPGDLAPEIELPTDEGTMFKLSSLRGKEVILYFYPKADTPGCTTESCQFRDQAKSITKKNAVIVGISPDTTAAQAKFKTKYGLPFTLLADADHKAAEAYGVWKEKSMYGKKYMGVERTTFLIDAEGKIKKIFTKVKPDGHALEVLAEL